MRNYTILICDDNSAVQDGLNSFLSNEGFHIISALDGETALDLFHQHRIDLIVLDIMLPGISGLDVCNKIRKESNLPIIMLSAKETELDRVIGLELGADDYVTKPFSPREMTIRIKKLLQRVYEHRENPALTLAELLFIQIAMWQP